MHLHTWADHVVHVELLSDDADIGTATRQFLERSFASRGADVTASRGRLELRSEPDTTVSASEVARALAEAGVRAHRVFDREEWSVAEVTTP